MPDVFERFPHSGVIRIHPRAGERRRFAAIYNTEMLLLLIKGLRAAPALARADTFGGAPREPRGIPVRFSLSVEDRRLLDETSERLGLRSTARFVEIALSGLADRLAYAKWKAAAPPEEVADAEESDDLEAERGFLASEIGADPGMFSIVTHVTRREADSMTSPRRRQRKPDK